ncbi:carbohydrate ABC transporter permease [Arthrobacter sp. H5]|uniref:carbohydrate ABC transporter permease n=1 Tax=Arthrobacter sp. H5 TaxID=1267973 RepID=UPI0004812F81|nr:carbohydrate ABC transporter permease [Arthrobacter sp. H5]
MPSTTVTLHNGRRRYASNAGAYVVLGVGGLVMVFPFIYQLMASLMTNSEVLSIPPQWIPSAFRLENYVAVFTSIPFAEQMSNTVQFSLIRTTAQVAFSALAGYAFARMRFKGSGILFGILLSILMVPSELLLISQYQIVNNLGWLNSMPGLVAPGLVSAFGTFMMRQFFRGLPNELEEAARIDGAGPFRIFWQVMLPLAKPGLGALAIITLIDCWGALLWPLIVTTAQDQMPVSVGLATFQGEHGVEYPSMMAASLMAMLPIIILFIVMQRRVIEGLAHAGLKG